MVLSRKGEGGVEEPRTIHFGPPLRRFSLQLKYIFLCEGEGLLKESIKGRGGGIGGGTPVSGFWAPIRMMVLVTRALTQCI